jgi:hypothetical protein
MKKRKKQIQEKYKKINSKGMHSISTRTIKVFVMQCARRSEKKSEETDNKRARPIGPRMGNRVEVGTHCLIIRTRKRARVLAD